MADIQKKGQEEESIPLLMYPFLFVIWLVLVILFIAFTILTLGIFLPSETDQKNASFKETGSVEEKLRVLLARKSNRLKKIYVRIQELQLIKNKIIKTERRVFFGVRLVIAALLILANYLYLSGLPEKDDAEAYAFIGNITNFNGFVLLIYSLPAYVLYGTVGRFTAAMQAKTTQILRKKHIPTFSEFQLLKEEEGPLRKDIDYLKMRLEEFA